MSLVDRDSLAKCCALLGGLTWVLAILVVAGSLMLLHEVAAIPEVGADTIAAGDASAAIASTTLLEANALRVFAVALAAFGVFAIAPVMAGISIATGRRAIHAGARGPTAILGLIGGGAYLAIIGGLLLGSMI